MDPKPTVPTADRALAAALRPEALHQACSVAAVPFATTAEIDAAPAYVGQARVAEAIRFAIETRHPGFNVFAIGPAGVDKRTLVRQLLAAARRPAPTSDWCYVANPTTPRRPRALRLPAGVGGPLRTEMARIVATLRVELEAALGSDDVCSRRQQLVHDLDRRQEAALDGVRRRARERQIEVVHTDDGIVLTPRRGDAVLSAAELDQLPDAERAAYDAAVEEIGRELATTLRTFEDWSRAHRAVVAAIDREVTARVAKAAFAAARVTFGPIAEAAAYLDAMEQDVIDHAGRFVAIQPGDEDDAGEPADADLVAEGVGLGLTTYVVNLIAEAAAAGAPIVEEDHPTVANLLGRVEHSVKGGALTTDFSLLRAGALHRANGGYLLLDAHKLRAQPAAWAALKRALQTGEIRIEDPDQQSGALATVSLEPEPIPLTDLRVVLLGDRELYAELSAEDPELENLFKVIADFDEAVARSPASEADYARMIAGLARRADLRPFDRDAVMRMIEHAARLSGDARRLSLHVEAVVDLLCEADHRAALAERAVATGRDVDDAIAAKLRRHDRAKGEILDAIVRETLLIATAGSAIGQINGISVAELVGGAFGYPLRITARVRVGDADIIDIEREVELGGPNHTKGIMILAGWVGARYLPRTPVPLRATIVLEQTYDAVEGDSASLGELCALLSAIGELPLSQAIAVTGSVNQHGEVQPVGGVNEKIEGYYDVCAARGLSGEHAVIIPASNVPHLMLRRDVVAAVADGRFRVHAVRHVDEAMELLTGLPAGEGTAAGGFPRETVNGRVEARLASFAARGHLAATAGRWSPISGETTRVARRCSRRWRLGRGR